MPGSYVVSYLIGYAAGKARDIVMVCVVLALALVNTLLSGTIALVASQGIRLEPPWTFLVSGLGVMLGEFIAIASGVALFVALYRYASPRRLSWRGSLIAAAVGTVGFELAKRLFGLYLAHAARGTFSIDINIGAATLLILWIWYMALVFLLGAAVAHVWEGRRVGS
jgi:membrane protein